MHREVSYIKLKWERLYKRPLVRRGVINAITIKLRRLEAKQDVTGAQDLEEPDFQALLSQDKCVH